MKEIVLTGIRPTGRLHIGHYFSVIKPLLKLLKEEDKYNVFLFIADFHALTTSYDIVKKIHEYRKQNIIELISCGLDKNNLTLFVQSAVPEHLEFYAMLSMVVPLGWLFRNPTYKEQMRNLEKKYTANLGFLAYPVLQAADILIHNADIVPIGKDQLPHLELTREIARKFNAIYGDILKEPSAMLTKQPKILGTDGRKMSKSYDNAIYITEEENNLKLKLMKLVTDPSRIRANDKGHPDICSVFSIHELITEEFEDIRNLCKDGKIGCVSCKNKLYENLLLELRPIREKAQQLQKDPQAIEDRITKANIIAKEHAKKILDKVYSDIGF